MANIKKVFQPIMTLLAANMDVTVSELYDQVAELAAAKTGGGGAGATTFHRNEDGVVTGIRCYYHKLWMSPEVAEFGKKASSPTGYNTMCKDGMSKWTKQQSNFKKAKEELLGQVAAGEVAPADITAKLEELQAEAETITAREDEYGFETLEQLLEDNAARGVAV